MRQSDVIVIGAGLAGLMAAAAAARRGRKVQLLAKGTGTLAMSSGCIDVLGYNEAGQPVQQPLTAVTALDASHPYRKIGPAGVQAALEFFLEICAAEGYAYKGQLQENQWLPTAAGTLKPSCLVPQTMDASLLPYAARVTVVGFEELKEYYPPLIAAGLAARQAKAAEYDTVMLQAGFQPGRNVTALDIARWLDTQEGQQALIAQLRTLRPAGSVLLVPPVLGSRPDYQVMETLTQATGCRFVEMVGLPTAVSGLRLRNLLLRYLKKQGVTVIEQADVQSAALENGRCTAVTTESLSRPRHYSADAYILATGGFLGKGLQSAPGRVWEPIFNLGVEAPRRPEEWSGDDLFAMAPQPYARFGLQVNQRLQPVAVDGRVLLYNVHIAGNNLAGYDYCFEKSGNGVAIASGYHAGMSV